MVTVGIDMAARGTRGSLSGGQGPADREIIRVAQDRAGFDRLDGWLERQPVRSRS